MLRVIIAVVGLLAMAGPAEAATTFLRPDGLASSPEWRARIDRDGSGTQGSEALPIADGWKTLDDNVQQPTDPDPASQVNADWIAADGPDALEHLTVQDVDLTGNVLIDGSKLWYHANTGAGTRLRVQVDWDGDSTPEAQQIVPAGGARQWRSIAIDPPAANVNDIELKFTSLDGGAAWVRAAYVELKHQPVALKRPLSGLVVIDKPDPEDGDPALPNTARHGLVQSYKNNENLIVNVSITRDWRDLEPTLGNFEFDDVLDPVIAAYRSIDARINFRLRILAGEAAPGWLKTATGGCIEVEASTDTSKRGCIAQFWEDYYQDRYRVLMDALAARYEDKPYVLEVANSACTTMFAEPFILGFKDSNAEKVYDGGRGLTQDKHRACLWRSTSDMLRAFTQTRITMAGHINWQFLLDASGVKQDWAAEKTILDNMRSQHGGRIVLEEHGLKASRVCDESDPGWYCYLREIGEFNTTAPPSLRTPFGFQFNDGGEATFANADRVANYGACNLEAWGFSYLEDWQRAKLDSDYETNCNW